MVHSHTTASRTTDWRLRLVLLAALGGLVFTALIVTVTRSMTATATRTPTATRTALRDAHPHRPSGTTTTTVPGALTGAVTRDRAGGACGFSLLGQTTPPTTGHARRPHVAASATAPTVPSPVGHCAVLEIGDSLGNDLGWGLLRHVAPTSGLDLVQLDKSSTGLVNSAFYDWSTQLAADLRRVHPQLVLISLGGNDEQGMEVNGAALQFPTPAWKAVYLDRVRQLVSEATASGAYVLWVGMPIMQQPSYGQGMQTLDALFQKGVTSEPNATFVSTWSLFSDPQGAFQSNAEVNGAQTTLREPDGIHYSFAGEDVIATYVIHEMALIYHVRLAPTNPATITGWG